MGRALPLDNVVVIIAMDEGEYASVKEYKGYQDRVYIKTLADLKVDEQGRLNLIELFAVEGSSGNFGGFKLGTPATIEKYKSVAGAIAQGV